eukprot:2140476-Rhodomonas_salina.1
MSMCLLLSLSSSSSSLFFCLGAGHRALDTADTLAVGSALLWAPFSLSSRCNTPSNRMFRARSLAQHSTPFDSSNTLSSLGRCPRSDRARDPNF